MSVLLLKKQEANQEWTRIVLRCGSVDLLQKCQVLYVYTQINLCFFFHTRLPGVVTFLILPSSYIIIFIP
jgi:hypothetical protein